MSDKHGMTVSSYENADTGMDVVKQNPVWHHHKNVSEHPEENF